MSNVAYWRPKKQVLCHIYPFQKPALRVHRLVPKRPNSSRNRAQHAFPAQLRTDALKKQVLCHIYPLQKPALRVHRLVPKRPNSSRNRAQHAFPAQRPECLTSRTDALKKQSLCHTYTPCRNQLWESIGWFRNGRKSSRNRAQHACPAQRPKCLTSRTDALKKQVWCHTYPLQKPALRVHRLVPKRPNSSRNRAQHAFPAQRPKCLTSRTDALKNKASATPTHCRNQLWESIGWFRNGRTAAGIVPNMPSQHRAWMSNVAYWRPKKTKLMPHLCHTYLLQKSLQKPALRVHWLVAKRPNGSRNPAQHWLVDGWLQTAEQQRTDALKKTQLMPHPPIAETNFESSLAGCDWPMEKNHAEWHQPVCYLVP